MGEVCIVPENLECCVGQRQVLLRPKANVDPLYLFFALRSEPVRHQIFWNEGTGSTVSNVRIPVLKDIRIPRMGAAEPIIAETLGALDDKIEVNQRINGTLEAMARAVFRDWFSRNAPAKVRAEELTKRGGLTINDGYRAKNSELGNEGLPFLRAANLKNGFETEGADCFPTEHLDKVGNKISTVGDVAFTSKGTIGRFAQVSEHTARFVYSPQVCFWRSEDHAMLHPAVLYCWMQSQDFLHQVHAAAGQTDMAPYVSLRDQRQMFVPDFDESHLEIAAVIEPLLDRKSHNLRENSTLANTRDFLLPNLMSGKIRLNGAEVAI